MKKYTLIIVLSVCYQLGLAQTLNSLNLMPVPSDVQLHSGRFNLSSNFNLRITGNPDKRIYPAATRFLVRLKNRTGLFFEQGNVTPSNQPLHTQLQIHIEQPAKVELGMDETYTLSITAEGIKLNAQNDIGAMRGLETLVQLVDSDEQGYYLPACGISDKPRFIWRGLMIDVARHFMPVAVIKRNIDGMAAVKMNVLHLHLSDDQGFRVESKAYPKLTELASDGLYFTQEQIKDIINYADARGIRVYPEFDVPGHATAILTAYPQFASKEGDYKLERAAGIFNPTLNPANPETYVFLNTLFKEMADLFPDAYFHIGGDENEGKQWNENKDIQKFMKKNNLKDNHALQAYFNSQLLKNLEEQGKNMMGWDEIIHEDLPKTAVIQSWRGLKAMVLAAKRGYHTVLSNGYYIDLLHSVDDHYLVDPLPDTLQLSDTEKERIIGGEATMWSELVTEHTIDSRIWPRTAAIAERLWSNAGVTDIDDMHRRLQVTSIELEQLGLQHITMPNSILRGLAQSNDIKPLQVLTGVCQPLQGYSRNKGGRIYLSYSPYMLFADACNADPQDVYPFNKAVIAFLNGDVSQKKLLETYLILWQQNHANFYSIMRKNPVLKEIEGHSIHLFVLATKGLEAMNYISTKTTPTADWVMKSKLAVSDARQPAGKTEIQIVNAVEKLIIACQTTTK